jgi:hypothetical protein
MNNLPDAPKTNPIKPNPTARRRPHDYGRNTMDAGRATHDEIMQNETNFPTPKMTLTSTPPTPYETPHLRSTQKTKPILPGPKRTAHNERRRTDEIFSAQFPRHPRISPQLSTTFSNVFERFHTYHPHFQPKNVSSPYPHTKPPC